MTEQNRKGIRIGDTVLYAGQRYGVGDVNERAVKIAGRWVNDREVEKEER